MNKTKKLFFRPSGDLLSKITLEPIAAKKIIPDWYKKLKMHIDGKSFPTVRNFSPNKTAKSCMPFFDSISSGYLLRLPADLIISYGEDGEVLINWTTGDFTPVNIHTKEQVGEYPIPEGYENDIFKMNGFWGIQAPKGYSLLYMHPLGRFDLPIYTFHAIVDADKHYVPMNLPFVVKKGFTGIIKRGTPYSQVIPIKRNTWKSEKKEFNEDGYNPNVVISDILVSIEKWYKHRIWERKEYT